MADDSTKKQQPDDLLAAYAARQAQKAGKSPTASEPRSKGTKRRTAIKAVAVIGTAFFGIVVFANWAVDAKIGANAPVSAGETDIKLLASMISPMLQSCADAEIQYGNYANYGDTRALVEGDQQAMACSTSIDRGVGEIERLKPGCGVTLAKSKEGLKHGRTQAIAYRGYKEAGVAEVTDSIIRDRADQLRSRLLEVATACFDAAPD